MSTKFVTQGTTIIKEAVTKDNAGEFELALSLYKQGIEYLLTGRKYEKNERIKAAIGDKVRMYMKRAEEISASLKEPAPAPKVCTYTHTAVHTLHARTLIGSDFY